MKLEENIKLLKEILLKSDNENFVQDFENELENIYNTKNPNMIEGLVLLLRDDFEYDELYFSIIHTIESFDDETYIRNVLKVTPKFIESSPKWAEIIFLRIINDDNCRQTLIDEIKDSKNNIGLKLLLNRIKLRSEELKNKTSVVLEAL